MKAVTREIGMFEPAIEQLLAELEELGHENDQRVSERRYKLLNLERPTAELIWLLLQSSPAAERARDRHLEWLQHDLARRSPAAHTGCALRQHRTLSRKARAGASEPGTRRIALRRWS